MSLSFFSSLSPRQIEQAGAMTFPSYRALVGSPDNTLLTVAAVRGAEVVGVALWDCGLPKGNARLLSLFVNPQERRQGIARALLEQSVGRLRDDVSTGNVYWSSTLPCAEAFEKLLMACGWSEKRLDMRRVSGTAQLSRDWAHRRKMDRMLNRPGWRFVSYDALTEQEKETISVAADAHDVPESWRPFAPIASDEKIIPELSLVLFHHGDVVAWLTTCEAPNGDVWYYRLFNVGAHTAVGAGMPLIVEVNRRHLLRNGPQARWRYNTNEEAPGMLAFIDRHASEFCDFEDFHWSSSVAIRPKVNDAVGQVEQVGAVG